MYYIFSERGELIATCDFEPNVDDLAERGEQAVESEALFTNPILIDGEIVDRGNQPSPYHEWSGKGWEINPQQKQAVFSAEKAAKLAEINRKAQDFINEIAHINDTPDFERETWSIQRQEAMAWIADNTASTPTLALIAQIRGVPLDTLRQKAYEKSVAYQTVAAMVAGQRQALEDRLMQAETVEDVRGIEVEYQLPQQGEQNE